MRIFCVWALLACTGMTSTAVAESGHVPGSLKTRSIPELVGENHDYAIDFLFFNNLAAGRLSLQPTERPDIFETELIGQTLGIAAWLTGDRTQRYSSLMQLLPDGRLRSLVHESQILKRKGDEWRRSGKRYTYDYVQCKVTREHFKHGRFKHAEVFDLPQEGGPVDILTAFYNLRAGIYGEIVPGATIKIPAFFKDGVKEIVVDVLTPEDIQQKPFFSREGCLLRVFIDPEIFETGSGNLYVWFNVDGIPERGIVEDVIGMGDVSGYQQEVKP